MESVIQILIICVCTFADHAATFFASLFNGSDLLLAGSSITLALALGVVTYGNIPEGILAAIRRWHGSIDDQFSAIDNLTTLLETGITKWVVPEAMLQELKDRRDTLQKLIDKCRTTSGSTLDRATRNTLLKTTVGYCLTTVKIWVLSEYMNGDMTVDDVHALGFLAPGETGGHHARKEPTDVLAEVKASIVNADFIHVVIDQASGENAALVRHGWPVGVRQAVIVILTADGATEVIRLMTNKLHNDIHMPAGSHGKQFIIKAAFLQHPDDEPKFGAAPTFSMPLTTEDLAAALDRQHHEDFEMQLREVERHRQELEQLKAKMAKGDGRTV
jgi:hypothetical protein